MKHEILVMIGRSISKNEKNPKPIILIVFKILILIFCVPYNQCSVTNRQLSGTLK